MIMIKSGSTFRSLLLAVFAAAIFNVPTAYALVGAHSHTNGNGDVFLGGSYIELGISQSGSFGTDDGGELPAGFYGTDEGGSNIGMSTNPTGFGVAPDLRMDFFLPGTPEERWVIGYKEDGNATTASNSLLVGPVDIAGNTVTNQSSGDVLKAKSEGTFNDKLKTTQIISFNKGDKFFKNDVTLKNVGSSPLDSVRFMRTFDPDNTVYQNGNFTTHNTIPFTYQNGDGKSVVIADTNVAGINDPVYAINNSYSSILFYSTDSRARVSTFGFTNTDPYDPLAYDEPAPKGTSIDQDQAITITFDVGTIAAGASKTVSYYTSLDNRDFSDVIHNIVTGDSDNISKTVENSGPNNGDGNGDGIKDGIQNDVTSLPNPTAGGGSFETLVVTGECTILNTISAKSEKAYGVDPNYTYPLGLTGYSLTCSKVGGTANIKMFYDKKYDTQNWRVRKYINGSFLNVSSAVFGTATVGSKKVTTLSYSVTDGGSLDEDGVANGLIIDPAGPAVLSAATAPNTGLAPKSMLPTISSLMIGAGLVLYGTKKKRFQFKTNSDIK